LTAKPTWLLRNSSEHAILQIPVGWGKTGLVALLPFGIAQGRVHVIAPKLEMRRGISTGFDTANLVSMVRELVQASESRGES